MANIPHEPSALRYTAALRSSPSESSSVNGSQLVLSANQSLAESPGEELENAAEGLERMDSHRALADVKELKGKVGKLFDRVGKKLARSSES